MNMEKMLEVIGDLKAIANHGASNLTAVERQQLLDQAEQLQNIYRASQKPNEE